MGITFVQKSDLGKPRPQARRALVLAGGAISGGAFKLGGLAAIERYFTNFSVVDFDIFMGISAGAFLAAPLAAGIDTDEMVESMIGEPGKITRFRMRDFYSPNWREWIERPANLVKDLATIGPRLSLQILRTIPANMSRLRQRGRDFVATPSPETAEALVEPFIDAMIEHMRGRQHAYVPSSLFDNSRIEAYIRENLERNGIPNSFRQLKLSRGKSLYIGATNLNTAQGVVFGHDEDNSVTISEAVQASTAIPGFFKPARLGPRGREQDYVDAAVRKTANISTAVRHGAELIVCYNPFRPFVNYSHRLISKDRTSIADHGMAVIINQAFRTMLHSRLRLGIEKLRLDDTFRGDVILVEPTETDARFFAMNPLAFWQRGAAMEHGFQSVRESLGKYHGTIEPILAAYGIEVDLSAIGDQLRDPERVARARPDADISQRPARKPLLRVVSGGR